MVPPTNAQVRLPERFGSTTSSTGAGRAGRSDAARRGGGADTSRGGFEADAAGGFDDATEGWAEAVVVGGGGGSVRAAVSLDPASIAVTASVGALNGTAAIAAGGGGPVRSEAPWASRPTSQLGAIARAKRSNSSSLSDPARHEEESLVRCIGSSIAVIGIGLTR